MSEESEVKRDKARPVKNSGRGHYNKGDARLGPFTVDIKEYPKGMRVDKKVWEKVCMDTIRNGDIAPALKLVLGDTDAKTRLWIIDDGMFKEMLSCWLEKNGE